jgi:hypothetical protein
LYCTQGKVRVVHTRGSEEYEVRSRFISPDCHFNSFQFAASRITRKSYGLRVPNRTMVAKFDHRFCFAGFGTDRLRRQEAMKTAGRENPNHGVALPVTEHMVRLVRTDPAQLSGLRSKKTFSRRRCVFSCFYLYRGGLNGSTQHSGRTRLALKTKAKSLSRARSAGTPPWLGFDRV